MDASTTNSCLEGGISIFISFSQAEKEATKMRRDSIRTKFFFIILKFKIPLNRWQNWEQINHIGFYSLRLNIW